MILLIVGVTGFAVSSGFAGDPNQHLREILPNGLTVIIKHNPDSRVFGVDILGKNRAAWEDDNLAGITDFVNRMLTQGTENKNAEQIQEALDDIGAQITTNDDPHLPYDDRYTWRAFSFIKFQTIDEYAEKGLDILYELVARPSFPEQEIQKTKMQVNGILGMESASTGQVCRNLYYSELFKGHPYAKTVLGNRQSVANINRELLLLHHKKYYSPANLILTIVSNYEPPKVMKWVKKRFGKMQPYPAKSPIVQIPQATSTVIEQKQKMEKEQVYIYLGNIVPGYRSSDASALILAAQILSSRLGLNLREKQGLAYSVGSDVAFLGDFGWYVVAMGTGYQNFHTAKAGILSEMRGLSANPPEQAELDKARNSLWGSALMRNMNTVNQAYNMAYYEFIGMPFNYDDEIMKSLKNVTVDDIERVSGQYFQADRYVLAYVGKYED